MKVNDIFLSLGSNSGDRYRIIGSATAELDTLFSGRGATVRVSSPIESEPMGFVSPNKFVNVGLRATFEPPVQMSVEDLHSLLYDIQAIENRLGKLPHRNPDGSYHDREIDIDIVAVDALVLDTPELTIPHPRMHSRPFVLKTMDSLMPDWVHPVLNLKPAELLEKIS